MENDEIIMELEKYPTIMDFLNIRKLLENKKDHPLIYYLKSNNTSSIRIIEHLNDLLLSIGIIKKTIPSNENELKRNLSVSKHFYDTLRELEWSKFLYERNILREIHPKLNRGNPDFKIYVNGKEYFADIFSKHYSGIYEQSFSIEGQLQEEIEEMNLNYSIEIRIKKLLRNNNIGILKSLILERILKPIDFTCGNANELHLFKNGNYKEWSNINRFYDPKYIISHNEEYKEYWKTWKESIVIISLNPNVTHNYIIAGPETAPFLNKSIFSKIKEKSQKYRDVPLICIIDLSRYPFNATEDRILFSNIELVMHKKSGMVYAGEFKYDEEIFEECKNISALVISRTKRIDNNFAIESQIIRNFNPNAKSPLTDEEARLFGELMN